MEICSFHVAHMHVPEEILFILVHTFSCFFLFMLFILFHMLSYVFIFFILFPNMFSNFLILFIFFRTLSYFFLDRFRV